MTIETGDLPSDLAYVLIWELYIFPTAGEEDSQPTTFVHKQSIDLEAIDIGCNDDRVIMGVLSDYVILRERVNSSFR